LYFYIGAHAINNNQWKLFKWLRAVYKRTGIGKLKGNEKYWG